jgi:iron-sulfur cluster repair protein YtfE (RIC family)
MVKDGLNYLMRDHAKVRELYSQFQSSTSFQAKKELVDKINKELSMHAAVEEQFLYPTIRRIRNSDKGNFWADRSLNEHQEVKETLQKLEYMQPDDANYDATVRFLMDNVNKHVQEEETELFPSLRAEMTQEELAMLEETLDKGKTMAPTHPHPMAPNKPPMNFLNNAVGVMDRVMDTVQGRKA